jgi:hypothetical protein
MQNGLVHLHNLLRWVILILLVISVIKAFTGWKQKKTFQQGDRKTWLFTMIAAHTTLVLGLYQWLLGRIGIISTELPEGTSMMKDKSFRFFWLEHPLMMLVSIALITLGYGMAKKPIADELKYKKAFQYFAIALLLILLATPWPFRDVIGRPLFPGMN